MRSQRRLLLFSTSCILFKITFIISMASRSDLGDVTPNNLGQVRILHKVLFPVNYGDNFYNDLLEAGEFAKLGTLLETRPKIDSH